MFEDGVDFGVDGDVTLEDLGVAELGDEGFGFFFEALALVADGEAGSGLGELLGDSPGDAAFVGEAEDDGDFAGEIDHDAGVLSDTVCDLKDSSRGGQNNSSGNGNDRSRSSASRRTTMFFGEKEV